MKTEHEFFNECLAFYSRDPWAEIFTRRPCKRSVNGYQIENVFVVPLEREYEQFGRWVRTPFFPHFYEIDVMYAYLFVVKPINSVHFFYFTDITLATTFCKTYKNMHSKSFWDDLYYKNTHYHYCIAAYHFTRSSYYKNISYES